MKHYAITRAIPAYIFAAISVVMLTLSSCGSYEEPELEPLTATQISGEALWNRMTVETDYTKYSPWEGHEGLRLGQSPHGILQRIYVNRTLQDAIPVPDGIAPDGSIVVKENYNEDEEMVSITVMMKVDGYVPGHNDWFWAAYTPRGEILAEGDVMMCVACHDGAADNDYVIVGDLRGRW